MIDRTSCIAVAISVVCLGLIVALRCAPRFASSASQIRPSTAEGNRQPLGHLPPVVRAIILIDAAGVDLGLDLDPGLGFLLHDQAATPARIAAGSSHHPSPSYRYLPRDEEGITQVSGNQTLVQRANGSATLYTREAPWELVDTNIGVAGKRFYDDSRGETRFDYIDPSTGIRTFGEEPYVGNNYGQGWSQQVPAY